MSQFMSDGGVGLLYGAGNRPPFHREQGDRRENPEQPTLSDRFLRAGVGI